MSIAEIRTAAINLRVLPSQRDLIDYAATLMNKSRSDFMLEAACLQAQNVVLDRTIFQLNEVQFEQFNTLLEQSTPTGLDKLLATKPVWENE